MKALSSSSPDILPLARRGREDLGEGVASKPCNSCNPFNSFNLFDSRFWLLFLTPLLLTGCLFKSATVPARHFVLSPISTNEPGASATTHLSVGIGLVKMPSYLLRNSIAVRNGANEIEYLDDAQWAERLDQSFQRTFAANLSRLLPSDHIYLADWGRDQVQAKVSINVQQFDVDTGGHGTLIAQWRITTPDSDKPVMSGNSSLARTGVSPHGNPEAIARTMSELTAEFSHELAQSISGAIKAGTISR